MDNNCNPRIIAGNTLHLMLSSTIVVDIKRIYLFHLEGGSQPSQQCNADCSRCFCCLFELTDWMTVKEWEMYLSPYFCQCQIRRLYLVANFALLSFLLNNSISHLSNAEPNCLLSTIHLKHLINGRVFLVQLTCEYRIPNEGWKQRRRSDMVIKMNVLGFCW